MSNVTFYVSVCVCACMLCESCVCLCVFMWNKETLKKKKETPSVLRGRITDAIACQFSPVTGTDCEANIAAKWGGGLLIHTCKS